MGLTIIHRPTSSPFGQPAAALDDVVLDIPLQIPHSGDTVLKQRMEKDFLRDAISMIEPQNPTKH